MYLSTSLRNSAEATMAYDFMATMEILKSIDNVYCSFHNKYFGQKLGSFFLEI
jgi:hypothetical protein